jgi:hypothetical protein
MLHHPPANRNASAAINEGQPDQYIAIFQIRHIQRQIEGLSQGPLAQGCLEQGRIELEGLDPRIIQPALKPTLMTTGIVGFALDHLTPVVEIHGFGQT